MGTFTVTTHQEVVAGTEPCTAVRIGSTSVVTPLSAENDVLRVLGHHASVLIDRAEASVRAGRAVEAARSFTDARAGLQECLADLSRVVPGMSGRAHGGPNAVHDHQTPGATR